MGGAPRQPLRRDLPQHPAHRADVPVVLRLPGVSAQGGGRCDQANAAALGLVCAGVSPIAVPAMPCPRGSDMMPALTCSATRTEVKMPRHSTAGTYEPQGGGICLIASPAALGRNSGKTKNHRNICTISGMLRKIST